MSTSAVVRAAWLTSVFEATSVKAITDKVYAYDVTQNTQKELSKLHFEQEINFITYLVKRAERDFLIGAKQYFYTVEVNVYREKDVAGANYTAAIDTFETIEGLINTALGNTWNGTVDLSRRPENDLEITTAIIGNKEVWQVLQTYTAEKRAS